MSGALKKYKSFKWQQSQYYERFGQFLIKLNTSITVEWKMHGCPIVELVIASVIANIHIVTKIFFKYHDSKAHLIMCVYFAKPKKFSISSCVCLSLY